MGYIAITAGQAVVKQLQQEAQRSSQGYTQTIKSEAFGAICEDIKE